MFDEFKELPIEAFEFLSQISGHPKDFIPATEAYISGLENLISGMVSEDTVKADESIRQLYAVSDQNAAYLGQLNPYWEEKNGERFFTALIKM